MNNNKQNQCSDDITLEFQSDTSLERFKEYVRFSQELENKDIDSAEVD